MRFMMLMIPKGYEAAPPEIDLDPKRVEEMMRYNEDSGAGGRAAGLRRPPPALGGSTGLVRGR